MPTVKCRGYLENAVPSVKCRGHLENPVPSVKCRGYLENPMPSIKCRGYLENPVPPIRIKVGQVTLHLSHCLASLCSGLSMNQVSQSFHCCQVHLAIQKSPVGWCQHYSLCTWRSIFISYNLIHGSYGSFDHECLQKVVVVFNSITTSGSHCWRSK